MPRKLFAAFLLTLVLPLGGCLTGVSSSPQHLPDLRLYAPAVRVKAHAEMLSGKCDTLASPYMTDYSVMRDQTRAAKKILSK